MNDAIKWDITNNACTARSQQQMSLDFHTQGTEDKTAGSVGALLVLATTGLSYLLGFSRALP